MPCNFYIAFMVICSLDVLKKSSKTKETRIKKEIVEVLQQTSYNKLVTVEMMDDETLGFDLGFVG